MCYLEASPGYEGPTRPKLSRPKPYFRVTMSTFIPLSLTQSLSVILESAHQNTRRHYPYERSICFICNGLIKIDCSLRQPLLSNAVQPVVCTITALKLKYADVYCLAVQECKRRTRLALSLLQYTVSTRNKWSPVQQDTRKQLGMWMTSQSLKTPSDSTGHLRSIRYCRSAVSQFAHLQQECHN